MPLENVVIKTLRENERRAAREATIAILEAIRTPCSEAIKAGHSVNCDHNDYGSDVVVVRPDPVLVWQAMIDALLAQYPRFRD